MAGRAPGEGAFYAPKLEWHLTDAIGRTWQVGTIQSDRVLPERLDASYVGDGERHRPVMLHRAIFGRGRTLHRHPDRAFRRQAAGMAGAHPGSGRDDCLGRRRLCEGSREAASGRRHPRGVDTDLRNEKINYKVREHSVAKVPNLLVVGKREAEEGTVALRVLGDQGQKMLTLTKSSRGWWPRRPARPEVKPAGTRRASWGMFATAVLGALGAGFVLFGLLAPANACRATAASLRRRATRRSSESSGSIPRS